MSNKLIVGNLKMNMLPNGIEKLFDIESNNKIVLCAPYIYLESLINKNKGNIEIGAENVFNKESGSYTGEISITMLKDIGVKYCLVGHPERRYIETDEIINEKILLCLKYDITPIICIGRNNKTKEINKELNVLLKGVTKNNIENIVLAFEPEDSIGKDKALDVKLIKAYIDTIRKEISKIYNEDISKKVKIIYGGSVNSSNSKEILEITDGILVGKSILNIEEFLRIK